MFELSRRNNGYLENRYDPFREMEQLERRFFGAPFGGFFDGQEMTQFKADITDEGDHYLLEADLPGFEKKDIHLDVNGDTLTIQAERHSKAEQKDDQNRILRVERSYGSYSRRFDLSQVDGQNIRAKYENGVLSLVLPKKETAPEQARRLEIE